MCKTKFQLHHKLYVYRIIIKLFHIYTQYSYSLIIISKQYTIFVYMKPISNIAAFIKYNREKQKFTQEQLAEMSGVGIHFIRDLEQGRSALRLDKVNQVLKMFGHRLSVSSDKIDPYEIWYNYFDKPVKITKKNNVEFYGFLVKEIRDEKSEIVAWKVVPNINAREWQKKMDDKFTITINQNEIANIELQKI